MVLLILMHLIAFLHLFLLRIMPTHAMHYASQDLVIILISWTAQAGLRLVRVS